MRHRRDHAELGGQTKPRPAGTPGAGASTAVNLAINIVQISALVVFSVLALGYRSSHPTGAPALNYDGQSLSTYKYQFATNPKDGSVIRDASGVPT